MTSWITRLTVSAMIYIMANLWGGATTNPEGESVKGSGEERRGSSANGAKGGSSPIGWEAGIGVVIAIEIVNKGSVSNWQRWGA